MSLRLPAYPAYKDSGIEWLGQIPAHWQLLRAKNVFRCIDIRSQTGDEELLTVSAKDGVVPRRTKSVTMFMAASYVGHKLCWPGDLVINSLWAWANGLGMSRDHGLVSSAYGVYRPLPHYAALWLYFDYLLRSTVYNWELNVRSKGVWTSRLQLTDKDFLSMAIVIPPVEEAEAISNFLQHTDRRVSRLIRIKRRLIELLNEQKQAVIHSAVTQGLDPDAPRKPSGVDWLGDIPTHWETWKISYFAKVGNGSTPSRTKPKYWTETGYPWLNSSTANQDVIVSADQFVTQIALDECHLPRVAVDSILIAITGQGKTRGKVAKLGIKATINQHLAYITIRKQIISPDYLHLYLSASYPRLRAISDDSGSTKGALTCEDIKHFNVVVPPIAEQNKLVCSVQAETSVQQNIIARTKREIELIREYRTRLIADVVTGKIDVRGFVPVSETAAEWETIGEEINTDDEADAEAIDGEEAQNYA